jgi:hypothetical protein
MPLKGKSRRDLSPDGYTKKLTCLNVYWSYAGGLPEKEGLELRLLPFLRGRPEKAVCSEWCEAVFPKDSYEC